MIADVVSLLLDQINQYLQQIDSNSQSTPQPAVMGNISQLDVPEIAAELENHLVLSLVNLEEEATLKNGRNAVSGLNNSVNYQNTPLHLNLFLLWTANYRNYATAIRRLGQIMTFFQGKNKFTLGNSPGSSLDPFLEFSLSMELLSLSLEEINHLWGVLGGKQLPFAAYRGRLITLKDDRLLDGGGLIREIEVVGQDATS
jgi:hypothetical protein